MTHSMMDIEAAARAALTRAGASPAVVEASGLACAWLEACGYKGIAMLLEALDETAPAAMAPALDLRLGGVDGGGVSAVFLAPALITLAREHGRITYRNTRHGLYLLPHAVGFDMAIGCPVDPAFSLGGPRDRNPYAEKLAAAKASGIAADAMLMERLRARS